MWCSAFGWLLDQELTRLGAFEFDYERSFAHFPDVKKLAYVVKDEQERS